MKQTLAKERIVLKQLLMDQDRAAAVLAGAAGAEGIGTAVPAALADFRVTPENVRRLLVDSGVGAASLPLGAVAGCAVYVDGALVNEESQKGAMYRLAVSVHGNDGRVVARPVYSEPRKWRRGPPGAAGGRTTTAERKARKRESTTRPGTGMAAGTGL